MSTLLLEWGCNLDDNFLFSLRLRDAYDVRYSPEQQQTLGPWRVCHTTLYILPQVPTEGIIIAGTKREAETHKSIPS